MRPVDLLKEPHVRQGVLAAGAERLARADLLDEVLGLALVAPAPDRLAEGTFVALDFTAAIDLDLGGSVFVQQRGGIDADPAVAEVALCVLFPAPVTDAARLQH